MSLIKKCLFLFVTAGMLLQCGSSNKLVFKSTSLYKTNLLRVVQISENAFTHTSYIQTTEFGNVPCNGLIVRDKNEVIVFDTPTDDKSATKLIQWIKDTLHCNIKAIIPTHFHDDCLGGLKAFDENKIPSFANFKTIELAKENQMNVPKYGFKDSLILKIGDKMVITKFFGEGHTKDNVVGYFPSENILFGGCLIKELNASKGYLGDANLASWSGTVKKLKNAYPNVKVVVPDIIPFPD
jgi:metallo-beta-lactamase class B